MKWNEYQLRRWRRICVYLKMLNSISCRSIRHQQKRKNSETFCKHCKKKHLHFIFPPLLLVGVLIISTWQILIVGHDSERAIGIQCLWVCVRMKELHTRTQTTYSNHSFEIMSQLLSISFHCSSFLF